MRDKDIGLLGILGGIPTYSMTGDAYAYEGHDDFDYGPAKKLDTTGPNSPLNPAYVSRTESAFVAQSYGDPQVTDTALASASFRGTPVMTGYR